MKALSAATILLVTLGVAGCGLLEMEEPPFRYLEVVLRTEETTDADSATGAPVLHVELENVSPQDIVSFRATIYLYRGQTREPVVVEWRNRLALPAGERREFVVDLAGALDAAPAGALSLDMLHVHRIAFADGTRWRDPLALYVWRPAAQAEREGARDAR